MNPPLRKDPAWQALAEHAREMGDVHLAKLFADDPARGERLVAEADGIYLDYSKNRVSDETLRLLLKLAEARGLRAHIESMFRGEKINRTEDRAVLHVALRAPERERIHLDGKDVVPEVHAVLGRMAAFSAEVREGRWLGHTGKRIRNVINIGIGGSDLGPAMACQALRHYGARQMTFRFVSNVDGTDFAEATRELDPAETLFIVCSKTFTTLEPLANATTAHACSLAALRDAQVVTLLFDAVSSLAGIAADAGLTLPELSLRWLLSRDVVTGVLLGGSKPEQLLSNIAAAQRGPLPVGVLEACDEVGHLLSGPMPAYNR